MRVAAILGPRSSPRQLEAFARIAPVHWTLGLPAIPSEADAVVIFGGDGTIHRHLKALIALRLPVLVVPRGSGNDFARALNLRTAGDARSAWRTFAATGSNVRTIDLGIIRPLTSAAEDGDPTLFCCVAGAGLDSEVNRRANRLPSWLRGNGGYALSLPAALAGFSPPIMKIQVTAGAASGDKAGTPQFVERHSGSAYLAAIANASAYGGGMKIAPRAVLDDGKLDVCVIRELPKLKLLRLFPSVYSGNHLQRPEVEYFQTERVRIETDPPVAVYADGEFVCSTPIEVSVLPKALRVITPELAPRRPASATLP